MSTSRFVCVLQFAHSWRATRDEINALLEALIDSLTASGVATLQIGGDLSQGTLRLEFESPSANEADDTDDSLVAIGLVVKALNSGRVSAPGWPDDAVIDDAIGSVKVNKFALLTAA